MNPKLDRLHERIRQLFVLELAHRRIHPSLKVPVWRLKDLDQTIDQLFQVLNEENCPEVLPAVPWFLEKNCEAWAQEFPPLIASQLGEARRNLQFHPGAWRETGTTLQAIEHWMQTSLGKKPIAAILGSDILYEAQAAIELAELLLRIQESCLERGHPRPCIWIADSGRPYLQVFIDEMQERGFSEPHTEIIFAEDHSDAHPRKEIFLIRFS